MFKKMYWLASAREVVAQPRHRHIQYTSISIYSTIMAQVIY